jgi:hypothetical protein
MAIVVVGSEKNFAELRPRLFGGGRVASKRAGEVAEAVRKANPHVDLDKLQPGTVLTVPDSADVELAAAVDVDKPMRDLAAGIAEHGQTVLAALAGAAEQREGRLREDRAQTLQAFDQVGQGARREKGLTQAIKEARKAVEEEERRADERSETLKQAQEEWSQGLEALKQLMG